MIIVRPLMPFGMLLKERPLLVNDAEQQGAVTVASMAYLP